MKKKINYLKIQQKILDDYKKDFTLFLTARKVPYCYLKEKQIYLNYTDFMIPNNRSVFDLLHEIGHLKTNTYNMKRCEEEYYATEWAIKMSKEYGFELDINQRELFQKYILDYVKTAQNRKAKNIPTVKQMTLNW